MGKKIVGPTKCKCKLTDVHDQAVIVAALRCMRSFYKNWMEEQRGLVPEQVRMAIDRRENCTRILIELGEE